MSNAPQAILDLVEHFARIIESDRGSAYNEAQVRKEFIDPMFEALGWDLANRTGAAEAYKDVIHEDAIKVGGTTKAPDYCFRIGGTRKFFVEAKRPAVDIVWEAESAYQLRRYAWSSKLPLSILTNFRTLAVYDCRIPPNRSDKPSTARILLVNYPEYPAQWENLAAIFSKEAVLKGFFDKYAEATRGKRGTSEVDAEFLKEIEKWRDKLARNFSLRNASIGVEQLNTAVQATIDRIIFLRMCEDRGVEPEGRLLALAGGERVYRRLIEVFYQADERYNSGLFHFRPERGRPSRPDELTPELSLDDDALKEILLALYYPRCRYEFSVMPTEILGNVYEQFLGKIIRLTAGHSARVEEKPEVRKAGGVYYTPQYIVDYIVRNTVGNLCEGKTPAEIESLRILDPACGSGSFLLGAYNFLAAFHRDWYVADGPQKHAGEVYQGRGGQWFLTTAEKKRILLSNIYGVDIDPQAVEVTKLSLLLKVLEEESSETLAQTLRSRHERALPDLDGNIKCGNSLIGPDFYEGKDPQNFTDEERRRINAFDWRAEFPSAFAAAKGRKSASGFSTVIGNPPYGATFTKGEAAFYARKYHVFEGVRDMYACFIEAAVNRLAKGGMLSFIVPSAWLGGPDYEKLRRFLLDYELERIILLPYDVFSQAYIDTTIFVLRKEQPHAAHQVRTHVFGKRERLAAIDIKESQYGVLPQLDWRRTEACKFVLDSAAMRILKHCRKACSFCLGDFVRMKRGVLFEPSLLTEKRTSAKSYRYFQGDVYRYHLNPFARKWVEFDDRMKERPKEITWFQHPRILLRRLVNRRQRLMATFASQTFITNKNLYSILAKRDAPHILALLGVINSRLVSYLYVSEVTQATKDDFPQVTIKDILALPFPGIPDKSREERMVQWVNRILELHQRLPGAKAANEKQQLEREIRQTDDQIDRLVYELYGLTEEEIDIAERP